MTDIPATITTFTDDAPISLGTLAERWLAEREVVGPGGDGHMIAAEFRPDGFYETWVVLPYGYHFQKNHQTVSQLAAALRKRPEVIDVTEVSDGLRVTMRFNAAAAAKRIGGYGDEAFRAGAEWLAENYPTFAPPLEPLVEITRDGFAVIRKLVTAQAGGVSLEGLGNVLDAAGWRHRVVMAAWPVDPYRAVKGLYGSGSLGRFYVQVDNPAAQTIPLGTPEIAAGAHVNVEPGTVLFSGTREVIDGKGAPKGFGLYGSEARVVIGTVLRAMESVEIVAPDGRSVTVPIERRHHSDVAPVGRGALDWLSAQGFAEVAERIYASLGARIRARLSRPSGAGAECQWCEHEQALRGGMLVDHGYFYPSAKGWRGGELGERVGSCIGVGRMPYEKSCDLLIERLPSLVAAEAAARSEMDGVVQLVANRGDAVVPESWVIQGGNRNRLALIPHGHPAWDRASELMIESARATWRAAQDEAAWCARRIERWAPRDIASGVRMAPKRRRR